MRIQVYVDDELFKKATIFSSQNCFNYSLYILYQYAQKN